MNHWLLSFAVGILSGILALLCGGFVAVACVKWYRISSFEGESGYFVVFLALLAGFLGLVIGIITGSVILKGPSGSLLLALAWSAGIVLGLSAFVATISWWFADISPKIDGDTLTIEAELQLPKGQTPPAAESGYSYLELHSIAGNTVRRTWPGDLHPDQARLEEGRWIVPGEVLLFTGRGNRSLLFSLIGQDPRGFLLPLPARPDASFLQWSDWMPRAPWPGTEAAFRFRLRKNTPPPPEPSYEEINQQEPGEKLARLTNLDLDAPTADWLPYLSGAEGEEQRRLAIERFITRSGFRKELGEMLVSDETECATVGLRLVDQIESDAGLVTEVTAVGQDLVERIKAFNATKPEDDPSYLGAADVSLRFGAWMAAARSLRENAGGDFTPELAEILKLSRVRPDSIVMRQDVCRVASYYLQQWAGIEALPGDPPPR
jgi:hypothetical protein